MMRPIPNFFLVGAAKAGTSSLWRYLDQHPDVYMCPIKEPNLFAAEVRAENLILEAQEIIKKNTEMLRRYIQGPMTEKIGWALVETWEDYQKLFSHANGQTAVGEASVVYLWSKTAAERIYSRIPNAKIVIVLRDPADRAFSQYMQAKWQNNLELSFTDYVQASLREQGGQITIEYPVLEFGLYYEQVKRYLDRFSPRNVHIILFEEEYKKDINKTLAALFEFLNVDPSVTIDTSQRHNEVVIPRSTALIRLLGGPIFLLGKCRIRIDVTRLPHAVRRVIWPLVFKPRSQFAMKPADRQFLTRYYRKDVDKLASLINRDLSSWLQ